MTLKRRKRLTSLLPGGTARYPFAGLLQILTPSYRQIFPLYADAERLSLKNSALAQIRQKCAEYKARLAEEVELVAGPSATVCRSVTDCYMLQPECWLCLCY